ncbi:MAG: diacylglycerol kinase [Pirellulaceae bacterium]
MSQRDRPPRRTWVRKFRDAFRGLWIGVRGQSSFAVHVPAAALVIAAGVVLKVSLAEWCLLALCITLVLAAEMFNSALESMAKAIDVEHNLHLADGLDIGSAAVLVAALGALVVGLLIFAPRVAALFS